MVIRCIYNRTRKKSEPLLEAGALLLESPKQVAAKAEIVFEVTANDESSRSVWLGDNGILAGASTDTVLIASSTLSIKWIDELIKLSSQQNKKLLDIALTGGRIGAETGNLTLLCGGDQDTLAHITPSLNSIASKITYFGPVGQGMRYKLILNYLQALHLVGFGHAMRLASAYGMNEQVVADALADRPGGVITGIAKNSYFTEPNPTTFSIDWITKDLTYTAAMADGQVDMPLLEIIKQEYERAKNAGFGDRDWARVVVLNDQKD